MFLNIDLEFVCTLSFKKKLWMENKIARFSFIEHFFYIYNKSNFILLIELE